MRKAFAYLIGFGVPLLVLSPAFSGAADSFPLSTFPMFASARGQPVLYAVLGRGDNGGVRRLEPALVGSKEVLQAKVLIQRAVEGGRAGMAELCRAIAARVAESPADGDVQAVEIVSRRYDPIGYFVRGPRPLEQTRLFRCAVRRAAREMAGSP